MAFYDPSLSVDLLPWRQLLELEKLSSSAYQSQLDKFKCTVDTTMALLLDVMLMKAKAELTSEEAQLWVQELKDDFCETVDGYEKFVSLAVKNIRKSLRAIASSYRHTAHMLFDSAEAFHRVADRFHEFLNLSAQKIRETLDAIDIIHCLFGFLLDYKFTHLTKADTCSGICAEYVIQKKNDPDQRILDQKLLNDTTSLPDPDDQLHVSCLDTRRVRSSTTIRSKAFLKWVFILLNMAAEVCQAAITQEAAEGRIGHEIYLQISIVTSLVCLIISLLEAFHEARANKVLWQKQRSCYWFYYPGQQGRLFGRVSLYFGILCSTVQLAINLVTKFTGRSYVKFDYVPLLLSFCLMVAAMIRSQGKTAEKVNCKSHGYNVAETMLVDGHGWVVECRNCKMEKSV